MRCPSLYPLVISFQLHGRVPVVVEQLLHGGLVHCRGNPAPVHLGADALVVVERAGLGVDEPERCCLACAQFLLGRVHPGSR